MENMDISLAGSEITELLGRFKTSQCLRYTGRTGWAVRKSVQGQLPRATRSKTEYSCATAALCKLDLS